MLHFGPFIFTSPWVLSALVVLPAIWLLLRVFPPAPERIKSPTIRLILGIPETEPEAARTPWWLVLLRLLVVSLLIFGFAHPILNPNQNLTNEGPLMLVMDNGWASAKDWDRKLAVANNLVDQAGRENRSVMIVTTAARQTGAEPPPPKALSPADAHAELNAMKPKPWATDRMAVLPVLNQIEMDKPFHVAWISDGLDDGHAKDFAESLQHFGTLELFRDRPEDLPVVLSSVDGAANGFGVGITRVATALPLILWVNVLDDKGRVLGRVNLTATPLSANETANLDMPVELRNRAARAEIESSSTVGGVMLLDDRVYRRKVGLVANSESSSAQPLLTDTHYIENAVKPFADLETGTVKEVLQDDVDVVIMTDADVIPNDTENQLADWISRGGLLLQFAGPKLANQGNDLLPVHLRDGARALGGAMTWSSPAKLAPFDRSSPFYGLDIPDDVVIRQQVLADPSPDLTRKTWAKLEDGTPLITAEAKGKGWTVLVHTTANPDWSNLPLSGLFVDMMQRIIATANGVAEPAKADKTAAPGPAAAAKNGDVLRPVNSLDAFGRLGPPMAGAQPIAADALRTTAAGPDHPPGIYGAAGVSRALNLASLNGPLGPQVAMKAIEALPGGVILSRYDESEETDLRAPLLLAALALALTDLMIALFLGGRLMTGARMILVAGLAGALLHGNPAHAAEMSGDTSAALSLHLAYVRTGDASVDQTSRAGLRGLSQVLRLRTSVQPDDPIGVSISNDELTFFPLIYWPVLADQTMPDDAALEKVRAYLRNGGTILFDTRDGDGSPALEADAVAPPATLALRKLLAALGHSRLDPPGPNHVITRSFYLTRWFPGRFADGQIWLDKTPSDIRDGVSSVVAGGNDWASAWAADSRGLPTNAIVDGGERQREMAYRFGVNLVMYVLTGNYKSDQVHVPFLLERLGRSRSQ